MPEDIIAVRLEIKKQNVWAEMEKVISSMQGFRIQKPDDLSPCDLLIMEIGDDLKEEFRLINSIQTSGAAGEIFLTSSHAETEILLGALRAGAKEFFPQPINKEEVKSSLIKFKERKAQAAQAEGKEKKGKTIAVLGSKGGVGTTTVAVNLAVSLASVSTRMNGKKSFSLMDINLFFGEIPLFMDIKSSFNWGDVAKDISRLDSTYLMSIFSKHPSGVHVLPSPSRLEGVEAATPENIEILVTQMQKAFDFIVIDSGHALNDISLKILELSDIVLIVSVLSIPCLINVKKLMDIFQKLDYPEENTVKVILNRHQKKSMISLEEAERSINRKFFWIIPNDYQNTMIAINQGKTLESVASKNAVAENFKQFASAFLQKREVETEKSTIFGNLFGRKSAK